MLGVKLKRISSHVSFIRHCPCRVTLLSDPLGETLDKAGKKKKKEN